MRRPSARPGADKIFPATTRHSPPCAGGHTTTVIHSTLPQRSPLMHRPIVKYVVRVALFASAVAAIACSTPTAPTVSAKRPATKDLSDTLTCRSGYTVVDGRVVCNPDA